MNAEFFINRRKHLEEQLPDRSLTFFFAGNPKQKTADMDYPFSVNRNFYYLTGSDRPGQILVLEKAGGKTVEWMFFARPDPHYELYNGKMPDIEDVLRDTGVQQADYLDRYDERMRRILGRGSIDELLFDFHKRDLDSTVYPENEMCRRLQEMNPAFRISSVSRLVNNLRRIKDEQELDCMRKAIDITALGIEAILDHMHDGVNEMELEAWFDFALTMNGAKDTAFDTIMAGGVNSNVLHYSSNNQVLHDGDVLLVDLGAEFGYYAADISRTFPVSGKFTEIQKTVYNAVLYGQQKVFEFLAPGKPVEEPLDVARQAIGEKLMEAGIIHDMEEMKKVLPHGVSHYVGLDCHDVGDRELLAPGMVVTMEPGAYLPELGFGVRIEDDALITESGAELLSARIPKTVEEIESYLAKRAR